ncbi:amino acid ABC transporter permease [Ornithinimicrobium sp. INDO-MA30-4]|uniref:amino acid ABC transporter permease n=1 Tax=Ornithinimicrobium sp. INDO-MA30-4 TaxID=2908651 RepID=UPI001F3C0074|nr:amino acid ABC transporter permease [Ornithinimicrobium sp. INDO-MA30-4]UJH70912.1 amino acid ABC transporter permease [Ornithinimicrobium sp. INDO-MA30-4]
MSAQQVLFDAPGPKAIARYRILAVAGLALLVGILGFIGFRMYEKGQLTAEKWSPFIDPNTWTNYYIPGFLDTIQAAAIAIVMSMIFGLLLAMGRMSDIKPVKWFFTAWVEFFRAVPVLIMMIFTFYYLSNSSWTPDSWNPFIGVIAGLVLYNSAVIGEIIRNGVQSLPNGQREAGLAVGLSPSKTRRLILVPQALTSMLPTLVSQVIVVLKDTALGYIILYPELLTRARQLGSAEANVLPAYIVAAVLFIIINYGLSRLAEYVENRQRAKNAGAAKKPDDEKKAGPPVVNQDPTSQAQQ